MLTEKPPLNFSITPSIRDIPKEDWDNLFGEDLIEGYGYRKTLEESNLEDFSFGYLVGKRLERTTVIIPFFIMNFSVEKLIRGPLHKLALILQRAFSVKILFLGSVTAEEFYWGIDGSENPDETMNRALSGLSEFCAKEKIKGMAFYDLSEKNKRLGDYLKTRQFVEMESLPTTLLKIESDSLEGYMHSLSKNMRRDLKRKLRKSADLVELRTELREDIDDILPQIYKLYLNNFNDSDIHFEILTPEFFGNICRNMPGVAKFFITYDKDKIVAFNLCLVKGNLFIDKFIGFDQDVAHKYHLYFTTFCHNLEWCMKNRIQYYQPGTTDYHPKMRLGAKPVPLHIYTKAFNPLLQFLLKSTAKLIAPKNIDPSWNGKK